MFRGFVCLYNDNLTISLTTSTNKFSFQGKSHNNLWSYVSCFLCKIYACYPTLAAVFRWCTGGILLIFWHGEVTQVLHTFTDVGLFDVGWAADEHGASAHPCATPIRALAPRLPGRPVTELVAPVCTVAGDGSGGRTERRHHPYHSKDQQKKPALFRHHIVLSQNSFICAVDHR